MALLLLPVRLVHEPNPLWRLTGLVWAMLAVGLTLGTAYVAGGAASVRKFGFSVGFFLLAVPWATPVERFMVETLTRANLVLTADLLTAFGIPAIRVGNVIEVRTGTVGIEEACSGIRSLQATLMLALFLGELYRLSLRRRIWCAATGIGLAFISNLGRTLLLSCVAAREGVKEVARWHNPTGVIGLVGCFLALYGQVLMLRPGAVKQRMAELLQGHLPEESSAPASGPAEDRQPAGSKFPVDSDPFTRRLAPHRPGAWRVLNRFLPAVKRTSCLRLASGIRAGIQSADRNSPLGGRPWLFAWLAAWMVAVEAIASIWYQSLEVDLALPVKWSLKFPVDNPSFTAKPMSPRVQHMLGCDRSITASWTDAEQRRWAANYIRWEPGRTAAHLARLHTPTACLPAAGWHLEALPGLRRLGPPLQPTLPFRAFRVSDEAKRSGFVFYCRTGDQRDTETEEDEEPTRWQRLRAVWKGRGEQGMTVLEIAVWGIAEEQEAQYIVTRELERMIVSSKAEN
jgi:exosortase